MRAGDVNRDGGSDIVGVRDGDGPLAAGDLNGDG